MVRYHFAARYQSAVEVMGTLEKVEAWKKRMNC
jgi:hypothetical protein